MLIKNFYIILTNTYNDFRLKMIRTLIITLIVLTGCLANNQDEPEIVEWEHYQTAPEPLELTTNLSRSDDIYKFNLFVENKSDSIINVTISGNGETYPYYFVILDDDSTIVWSEHKSSRSLAALNYNIASGKELVRTFNWIPNSNYNRRLSPEITYTLYGVADFSTDWNNERGLSEPPYYITPPIRFQLK